MSGKFGVKSVDGEAAARAASIYIKRVDVRHGEVAESATNADFLDLQKSQEERLHETGPGMAAGDGLEQRTASGGRTCTIYLNTVLQN